MKKSGIVLLLGRPNVGKSTLLNTLIGQKVSITSPKSQTTRAPLKALLFIDTPGVFLKAQDKLSKTINRRTMSSVQDDFDVVLYIVDQTRPRDYEEGRVAGISRTITKPKILVINKADVIEPNYYAEYRFCSWCRHNGFVCNIERRPRTTILCRIIFSLSGCNGLG